MKGDGIWRTAERLTLDGHSRSSIVAVGRQVYFGTKVGKLIDSDCFYFLSELGSKVLC